MNKQARIFRLFLDTHMGLGHTGLCELAQKAKINVNSLAEDDLLMFLNKHGDKMKLLGAQGRVIGYLKLPDRRPIMKEALQYIPKTFGSSGFDYDAACLKALQKRLGHSLEN